MILRTVDGTKYQVISSYVDRLSLAVYAEHSPALEPRCDGFFVYKKGIKLKPGGICADNAALRKP